MSEVTSQLRDPGSRSGTIGTLGAILATLGFGLYLVYADFVSIPTDPGFLVIVGGFGLLTGILATIAPYRSETLAGWWRAFWFRAALLVTVVVTALLAFQYEILRTESVFVWAVGLLVAGACTRLAIYYRAQAGPG